MIQCEEFMCLMIAEISTKICKLSIMLSVDVIKPCSKVITDCGMKDASVKWK